jgi:phosphatidylserine/phosphatidylglycerophosphate/cardiolipin synthase-like enzyme
MRRFVVAASDVSVHVEPAALHAALLQGIEAARHRVSIASLYIGGGEREAALVTALADRVRRRHCSLRCRGETHCFTRAPSCALAGPCGSQCRV